MAKHAYPLIFMHIPKAGGTSLLQIIRNQYKPNQISAIKAVGERHTIKVGSRIKVITGHEVFGSHERIPNARYFTVVRNPVDRTVSYYNYIKRTPHHFLYERGFDPSMSLDQFLDAKLSTDIDNGQVRFIAGLETPFGSLKQQDLQTAKYNIQTHMDIVGLLERMPETISLLASAYNWKVAEIPQANKTNPAQKTALSSETVARIEAINQLDIALYDYVVNRFDDLLNGLKNQTGLFASKPWYKRW